MEKLVTPSIDWITGTTKKDEIGLRWYELFNDYKDGQEATQEVKDWAKYGYNGKQCGNVLWGYNPENGYLLTAMSSVAHVYWHQMVGPSVNVTRVDLAVTIEYSRAIRNLAAKYFNMARVHGLDKPQKRIMQSNDGGQTLYVGSVHSEQLGRVYDKGVHLGTNPPGEIWRYEVTYRKPRASQVAQVLMELNRTSGATIETIASTVYDWFLSRGVRPMFDATGDPLRAQVYVDETSVDRKLRWLQTQVRPSIAWLMSKGKDQEVLDALGLQYLQSD